MSENCCGPGETCGPEPSRASAVTRRAFLGASSQLVVLGALPLRAFAGPFLARTADEFPIPADKQLDPHWFASLRARGAATVYRKSEGELDFIGMPIGGICTGQLYMGGDGRLWLWDVFNVPPQNGCNDSGGAHYAKPMKAASPLEFAFRIARHSIDATQISTLPGGDEVEFRGEYPIASIDSHRGADPFRVTMEAFSPFCPLDADSSGLPATVFEITVRNEGSTAARATIEARLENAICKWSDSLGRFTRTNRPAITPGFTLLTCEAAPGEDQRERRDDLPLDDFERDDWAGWTATGDAFGSGPMKLADVASYQGDVAAHGDHLVNTHETRTGDDVVKADQHVGTLTSRVFTIERRFLSFRIGGGNHPGKTCINLVVDAKIVRTMPGRNEDRMHLADFDVRDLEGRSAQLQIVDEFAGGWGQIKIDDIVQTDRPRGIANDPRGIPDFGSMAVALLQGGGSAGGEDTADGSLPVGSVARKFELAPNASATFRFVVAWHFDALQWDALRFIPKIEERRRHYGSRFYHAREVVEYVAQNYDRLASTTKAWRDAFYGSSLPHWFLERTFATVSTLATATCLRFDDGRFYGWEGTYCCAGTCTHVWQYAQAVARVFPALERDTRERVDYGSSFHDDSGLVDYRGEASKELAIDGQCGVILRTWREHTMAPDSEFLKRVWPRVKKSIELLIARDVDEDGILDGAQYNTLDTTWWGQIAWISSLYLGAVKAGARMAEEMGDAEFAKRCDAIARRGSDNMVARLFDGEYFVQQVDPAHPEANASGAGCHADQLLGQSWALQYGLGRVVPHAQARSALAAIYKYNFAPNAGRYRDQMQGAIQGGRWYALEGEAGLVVCTFPKGGAENAPGKSNDKWAAMYLNEVWTGFEHQVAAHMMWEGLVDEALVIERALHDRHHAKKRNPWNEIECGDHYARAMSGFGVYLAACGFEIHGPRGHIGFAPRIGPEDFKAAFIASEGWGRFEQKRDAKLQRETLAVLWGKLRVKTLSFEVADGARVATVSVKSGGAALAARFTQADRRVEIALDADARIVASGVLTVDLSQA